GLRETERDSGYHASVGPEVTGRLTRSPIERSNDYKQAGERYHLQEDWERDELVANLVDKLSQCDRPIQERMVWHFYMADDEYGRRVGDGLGISVEDVKHLEPLVTQRLTEEEQERLRNLGHNGPRNVEGLTM